MRKFFHVRGEIMSLIQGCQRSCTLSRTCIINSIAMSVMLHDKTIAQDVQGEFLELASGCGVFKLDSRARISLTGDDRVRWLNGMVTNNVRDLAVGHGVYAFLLNPQGHILGDLYAYNRGDSILVDTDASQIEKLLATFDRYIIMDDVEVVQVTDKIAAVGVAGPQARAVTRGAKIEVPTLEPLQFAEAKFSDISLTIVRGDNPAVETYEIWLAPADQPQVWEALMLGGGKPASAGALELLRIAAGIPRYLQDIRERDLPQETEQTRALNFNKGCYIGQEIVERIRSRGAVHRKFSGFDVEGPLPPPGTKIQADGKDVGEITTSTGLPLPSGERRVALGYIRREIGITGRKFQAADATITVVNLPFPGIFQIQIATN